MQLNLNHVHVSDMGYGRLGVELAKALESAGVEVFDHLPGPGRPDGIGAEGRHSGLAGSLLWVCTPPQAYGWWSTQSSSILTMWEATRVPESFRENLDAFETILVPSEQNLELFSRYHRDVRLVYLGIDPVAWRFVERTEPGMYFDFLIGGSGKRKGTDVAFEAFRAAFPTASPDSPIPRLVMKNHAGEDFRHDGRVMVIGGKISAEAELDLYASAHCYVQPSRGEGFGMQPLQAMAQGMPTILTDAHGHEAFAHLGYGIGSKLDTADYFFYGDAGQWWEPDVDELVDQMRWVYDHYDEAREHARIASAIVREEFSWARCADGVMANIDCSRPYVEGGEWFEPSRLKFRIRVNSRRRLDIAGREFFMEPGVDYWETADVKRILAENGSLAQECIDEEDSGLTDAQLARLATNAGGSDNDMTRWHAGAI